MVFAIDLWSISEKKCSSKTETGVRMEDEIDNSPRLQPLGVVNLKLKEAELGFLCKYVKRKSSD